MRRLRSVRATAAAPRGARRPPGRGIPMPGATVAIRGAVRAGELTVDCAGELDALTVPDVERALLFSCARLAGRGPTSRGGHPRLRADLSGVSFCGVSALTMLLHVADVADTCGVELELCSPSHTVLRVLDLTATASRFRILTGAAPGAAHGPEVAS